MGRYIILDTEKFEAFMKEKQFERTTSGNELVFIRRHDKDPRLMVKCFSGISGGVSRECGEDAIRVVGVFDNGEKSFGIYKAQRVYRTGSTEKVIERTYERLREAYQALNDWRKTNWIK